MIPKILKVVSSPNKTTLKLKIRNLVAFPHSVAQLRWSEAQKQTFKKFSTKKVLETNLTIRNLTLRGGGGGGGKG